MIIFSFRIKNLGLNKFLQLSSWKDIADFEKIFVKIKNSESGLKCFFFFYLHNLSTDWVKIIVRMQKLTDLDKHRLHTPKLTGSWLYYSLWQSMWCRTGIRITSLAISFWMAPIRWWSASAWIFQTSLQSHRRWWRGPWIEVLHYKRN